MYSSVSTLDRDVARAFLHAPSNSISHAPMLMQKKSNRNTPQSPSFVYTNERFSENFLPSPHSNAQLGYPTNQNLVPMYYDVIIDTVTDYDIFYPIAKQTEKHYYDSKNEQQTITNEVYNHPNHRVQRLDELAVSIDLPHDYTSTSQWPNHSMQNHEYRHTIQPESPRQPLTPSDQYYFYSDNDQSPVRYLTTPFFWFRPVVDQNYAICIPTNQPSLHAYVTPLFQLSSSTETVRL
ncbi:unnamed protein product [Adineta ricciae]|uniref:Uncharacterized protein n=1 Tax=Adineta ricciae TaxID=249248 RepID=A0A814D5G4_ADIRI|nr:unnamed protein product [Adineta ricciae]CAF1268000.1 unnamed protein product [Adineta ricciae]